MNEFELRRRLADLRQEREPGHDLWPAIERAIAVAPAARGRHPGRWPHWHGWAMAASLALAALLLWPQQAEQELPPVASALPRSPAHIAIERQADALSIEYRVALAQLAGGPLPDELRPALRELRDSEAQIREALRQNPESTYLLSQLRRTYEQQLRLSQRVAFG